MSLKHYIIVRFFNCTLGNFTLEDVMSDYMLEMGVKQLKSNLIRSLNNQTCKNFELILLVNNLIDLNNVYIQQLFQLQKQCSFKVHVVHTNQLNCVVDFSDLHKIQIISRVDYDDLILNTVVYDIQQYSQLYQTKACLIYGYNYGYAWRADTSQLYEIDKIYNFNGHFSAMQSTDFNPDKNIGLSNDAMKELININPYMWDHSSVKKYVNNLSKDIANEIEIQHNINIRAFVWMRHKNTGSINPFALNGDRVHQIKNMPIANAIDFQKFFGRSLEVKA